MSRQDARRATLVARLAERERSVRTLELQLAAARRAHDEARRALSNHDAQRERDER